MISNKRLDQAGRLFYIPVLVIVFALAFAGQVFADGEAPPAEAQPAEAETPAADETQPDAPAAGETTEEAPPAADTQPAEALPAPESEAPVALEEAVTEEAAGEETAADTPPADEAPAGTDEVILVDPEGEPLDYASQESADLMVFPDPYFYVGTTKYAFTSADCDPDTPGDQFCPDPLDAALAYMDTNGILPTDRKLYVEAGTYPGFTLDGSLSPQWQLLNGIIGEDGSGTTYITGNISILNNLNGFTLSGFNVDGFVNFSDNSGTLNLEDLVVSNSPSNGITVSNHTGAVNVSGVDASQNDAKGAVISNILGNHPVNVSNSVFNSNGYASGSPMVGLEISSNRAVTINGVSAKNNQGDGIDVYNFSSLTVKNANLSGNQEAGPNITLWGFGLYASTSQQAGITLENVYANNNHGGFYLSTSGSLKAKQIEAKSNNDGAPGDTTDHGLYFNSPLGSSRIEFGDFSSNGQDGLHITNKGNIYLSSITAVYNGGNGAYLDNLIETSPMVYTGTGSVMMTSPKSGSWLQANSFSNNGQNGLQILSRRSISVYNIFATDNGVNGTIIENSAGPGSVTVGTNTHTMTNEFKNNADFGLTIFSSGNVTVFDSEASLNILTGIDIDTGGTISLKNIDASENTELGAVLNNSSATRAKNVSITDSAFNSNQNAFLGGLLVQSKGNIALKGVEGKFNAGYGVHLMNTFGSGKVSVLFSKSSDLMEFSNNGEMGLGIESFGAVIVDSISAIDNGKSGLWIYNPDSRGSVTVRNTNTTLNPNSQFINNAWAGIYIRTQGNILLTNIIAAGNGWSGADLDNCLEGAPGECGGFGGISIKASKNIQNLFDANGEFGLLALSRGSILLTNVTSIYNGLDGAYLRNDFLGSSGKITISTSGNEAPNVFSWNGTNPGYAGQFVTIAEFKGLAAKSFGNISAKNIDASENTVSGGAYLYNADSPLSRTVSVQNGTFFNNGVDGLFAWTKGSISLKDITANGNAWSGVFLDNSFGSGNITLSSSKNYTNDFSFNNTGANTPAAGLNAFSNGTIAITNVNAMYNSNGARGINLDNSSAMASRKVSAANIYTSNNDSDGLNIVSSGPVTVTGIDAESNGGKGLVIVTQGFAGKVTLTTSAKHKTSQLNNNNNEGGLIYTDGAVYAQNLDASGNGLAGLLIDNTSGSGPVTYSAAGKSSLFNGNQAYGLQINSSGTVSVSSSKYKIFADSNGTIGNFAGIRIDNSAAPAARNVTLKNLASMNNAGAGIEVDSAGAVKMTSLTSLGNGNQGVLVVNTLGTGSVSLNGDNTLNFNTIGLMIETNGAVTVSSLMAFGNSLDGMYVQSSDQDIKVSNATLRGNGRNGMWLNMGSGNAVLTNVVALNNFADGARIWFDTAGTVTIKNSAFQNNSESGIEIDTLDPLYVPALSKVTAFGNDVNGGAPDADINVF